MSKIFLKKYTPLDHKDHVCLFVLFCFVFVLRYINLIGHLMPNQVKENKSEKKFQK